MTTADYPETMNADSTTARFSQRPYWRADRRGIRLGLAAGIASITAMVLIGTVMQAIDGWAGIIAGALIVSAQTALLIRWHRTRSATNGSPTAEASPTARP